MNKVRSESDPHIVTGVLQKTLKEMTPSPMYGVYDDILATDISEDSALSRTNVRNWLVKLPPDRFQMVCTMGGNAESYAFFMSVNSLTSLI